MAPILVIGGSGGIGSAIVRRFASDGEDVLFTYFKAAQSAEKVAASCVGGAVEIMQLDVRDQDSITRVVDACGPELRAVVFCAASGVLVRPSEAKPKHWDWTLDINVRGCGLMFRATLPVLARNQGSMAVLTSSGSRTVLPGYALVGAAKAAMESLVRYAAVEGGPHRVRVNAVCPGVVDTRGLAPFPNRASHLSEAIARTPLGRLVTEDDVAGLVRWLATDDACMITGQTIVVDGGWELAGMLVPGVAGLDA